MLLLSRTNPVEHELHCDPLVLFELFEREQLAQLAGHAEQPLFEEFRVNPEMHFKHWVSFREVFHSHRLQFAEQERHWLREML